MKKLLLSAVAAVFALTAGVSEVSAARIHDQINSSWINGVQNIEQIRQALRNIYNMTHDFRNTGMVENFSKHIDKAEVALSKVSDNSKKVVWNGNANLKTAAKEIQEAENLLASINNSELLEFIEEYINGINNIVRQNMSPSYSKDSKNVYDNLSNLVYACQQLVDAFNAAKDNLKYSNVIDPKTLQIGDEQINASEDEQPAWVIDNNLEEKYVEDEEDTQANINQQEPSNESNSIIDRANSLSEKANLYGR